MAAWETDTKDTRFLVWDFCQKCTNWNLIMKKHIENSNLGTLQKSLTNTPQKWQDHESKDWGTVSDERRVKRRSWMHGLHRAQKKDINGETGKIWPKSVVCPNVSFLVLITAVVMGDTKIQEVEWRVYNTLLPFLQLFCTSNVENH